MENLKKIEDLLPIHRFQQFTTQLSMKKTLKRHRFAMFIIPPLISAIAIAWFTVDPLQNEENKGPLIADPVEISVRHQDFWLTCQTGPKSIYFAAVILVALAAISLLASFFNLSIPTQHSDRYRNMVKLSWNMMLVAAIAGAIVTFAFFFSNALEASALICIAICIIVISTLFSTKANGQTRPNRTDSIART